MFLYWPGPQTSPELTTRKRKDWMSFGRLLILYWLLGQTTSVLLIQLRMSGVWRLGLTALKWNPLCLYTSPLWQARQEGVDSRQKSPKLFSLDLPFQSRAERDKHMHAARCTWGQRKNPVRDRNYDIPLRTDSKHRQPPSMLLDSVTYIVLNCISCLLCLFNTTDTCFWGKSASSVRLTLVGKHLDLDISWRRTGSRDNKEKSTTYRNLVERKSKEKTSQCWIKCLNFGVKTLQRNEHFESNGKKKWFKLCSEN